MAIKKLQDADALLLYKVGPVYCCSPALTVEAVILPPNLTHLPGYNDAEPGFFKHACGMVQVVDLRKRFGIEREKWVAPGKIIIVEVEGGYAGFWVDEILDVVHFPEKGWTNAPACIPREVFKRTLLLNKKIKLYCDFEALFKFRETGYLREYIATLEPAENSRQIAEVKNDNLHAKELIINKDQKEWTSTNKSAVAKKENDRPSLISTKNIELTGPSIKKVELHHDNKIKKDRCPDVSSGMPHEDQNKLTIKKDRVLYDEVSTRGLSSGENYGLTESKETGEQADVKVTVTSLPEEQSSGPGFLLGVFFIFLVTILGSGYFLFKDDARQAVSDRPARLLRQDGDTGKGVYKPEVKIKTNISPQAELAPVPEAGNDYHAEIISHDDVVTIVVNVPAASKNEDILIQPDDKSVTEALEAKRLLASEIEITNEVVKNRIISREIFHIVVKGDTLWHIAKRYIKDPYRYPELARLSKIKNPDLIYPGNKVRIIINGAGE